MPSYELCLIVRSVPKVELANIVKRAATTLLDHRSYIRTIEYIGGGPLPHKISAHGLPYRNSENFVIKFDTGMDKLRVLEETFARDVDIIRKRIYKVQLPEDAPCTLHEEMLPPAYRKEVINMINIAKNTPPKYTFQFKHNSGLDYYPFNK